MLVARWFGIDGDAMRPSLANADDIDSSTTARARLGRLARTFRQLRRSTALAAMASQPST